MRDLSRPPRRYGRLGLGWRRLARALGTHLLGGQRGYARRLERQLVVERLLLPAEGRAAGLAGLRVVQLSDLHAGPFLDEAGLEPVVDLVTALGPDLLLITGDLITDSLDDFDLLGTFFARLPARLGAFAVLGNHDCRGRREGELGRRLQRQGVRLLRDASAGVPWRGGRLHVVGLADLEEGRGADLDAALRLVPEDEPALLLCHHPGVRDGLGDGRFELVLSGHTHGGQLRTPWSGPLTREGVPAQGSHALIGGGRLHVNRGLGVLLLPLRCGAPPEITLIEWLGEEPPST